MMIIRAKRGENLEIFQIIYCYFIFLIVHFGKKKQLHIIYYYYLILRLENNDNSNNNNLREAPRKNWEFYNNMLLFVFFFLFFLLKQKQTIYYHLLFLFFLFGKQRIIMIIITTMALVPQGQKRNFQLSAPSAQERRKGLSIIVVMVSQQTDCWNLHCKYNTIDTLQNWETILPKTEKTFWLAPVCPLRLPTVGWLSELVFGVAKRTQKLPNFIWITFAPCAKWQK